MEDRCKTVQENLAAWLEEELPVEMQQQYEEHISQCSYCRHAADAQREVRKALHRLRQLHSGITPPSSLWRNVAKEIRRRESHKHRIVHWQAAFASILVTCLLIGGVWAKLNRSHAFPAEETLQNYREWYAHQSAPVYLSDNPSNAAKWLSHQLHASVLPIDLSLSSAKLIGADMVRVAGVKMGRLLYSSGSTHLVMYVSPGHMEFRSLQKMVSDGDTLREASSGRNFILFGWGAGNAGYALVSNVYDLGEEAAVDAERQTKLP